MSGGKGEKSVAVGEKIKQKVFARSFGIHSQWSADVAVGRGAGQPSGGGTVLARP